MGSGFLIDTNVVIDGVGNKLPQEAARLFGSILPTVSVITYIEALDWHKASVAELSSITAFMVSAIVLPINESIIYQTVSILQQKKMGLGDAIIAATALVHSLTLLTRNISDFRAVTGLEVVNPWDR